MNKEEAQKVLDIIDGEEYTDRIQEFCYKFPKHGGLAEKEHLRITGVELEETYNVG